MIDIDEIDEEAIAAQKKVLEDMGGKEEIMKTFKPSFFSPIPDLKK